MIKIIIIWSLTRSKTISIQPEVNNNNTYILHDYFFNQNESKMPKQCIKTMWFTLTWSCKTTFSNNNFTLLFLVWFYQCPKLLSKNCVPLFFTTLLQLIEVCGHSFVHSMLEIPPQYFMVEVSTLTGTFHTLILFIFNHFLVDLLLHLSFIFQIDDLTFDLRSSGCKISPNRHSSIVLDSTRCQ